jgi:hypothetical protein
MAKLKGNFPRIPTCLTLDPELLALLRVIQLENGLSLSSLVESLVLDGLKNLKIRGSEIK